MGRNGWSGRLPTPHDVLNLWSPIDGYLLPLFSYFSWLQKPNTAPEAIAVERQKTTKCPPVRPGCNDKYRSAIITSPIDWGLIKRPPDRLGKRLHRFCKFGPRVEQFLKQHQQWQGNTFGCSFPKDDSAIHLSSRIIVLQYNYFCFIAFPCIVKMIAVCLSFQ